MSTHSDDLLSSPVTLAIHGLGPPEPHSAPGPGSWAAVLQFANSFHRQCLSGQAPNTDSYAMELHAVRMGLQALPQPTTLTIIGDSASVILPLWAQWMVPCHPGEDPPDNLKRYGPCRDQWYALFADLAPHTVRWIAINTGTGVDLVDHAHALAEDALRRTLQPSSY